jgi:hypothetical protein
MPLNSPPTTINLYSFAEWTSSVIDCSAHKFELYDGKAPNVLSAVSEETIVRLD